MRLTSTMLRRIIAEEIQKLNKRNRLSESKAESPVKVTPAYINKIIAEELELHRRRQRLAESRRRRARNSYYY